MALVHKYNLRDVNIVIDANSGAIHVVDEIVYNMLDYYKEKNKEEIFETLKEKFSNEDLEGAYKDIRNLEDDGVLFTEEDYMHNPNFVNRKPVIKALCMNVAHDCNLKCKYCFASQGDFGGEKKLLPLEVGKKALKYLVQNSGTRRNLEVDFFGGEPLLNFEVVKELVDYGRELEKDYNKNFRFTLTTNGLLLDDEKIKYLNENMKNLVLSLDGRKKVNDLMRTTINDKGSYDLIIDKYRRLIKDRKDKEYFVRGTFTKFNLDFAEDVKHYKELGFDITSMEPAVDDKMSYFALTDEDLPKIFEEYEKLADFYLEEKKNKTGFIFYHFNVDLKQGPCAIKRLTGCGAGSEYICVTPEGDIYPCHQFVGDEKFKMGNILDQEINLNRDMQLEFQNAHVYAKQDCQNCWAKYYCSGGCHANAYNFNKNILKPYKLGCEMLKKRIECAIMIEAKLMLEGE